MVNRIKVLYISSWYPTRISPTNGDFVQRHAEATALLNDTYVVHVIADNHLSGKNFEIKEFDENNVHHLIVYFKKHQSRFFGKLINITRYLYYYFKGYIHLSAKFGRPNIIHANITYPIIIIAFLLSKFYRTPFVIAEHWTKYLTARPPAIALTRILMRSCKMLMPVSKNLALAFRKQGITTNYNVIPNVVDISRFTLKRLETKQLRLTHLSSMKEEQKNIIGIIEAFNNFSSKEKNVQLNFIGRYTDEQKELAKKYGLLNKSIFFDSFISHDQVPEKLQQADALVLFSNYENLPCIIIEAFACGLPVISTAVGGIDEHINNSNGILINKGDISGLENAFFEIKEKINTFDRNSIRQYAINNFSKEIISEKFNRIYCKVLNINP
jgi:L-malate glycosyltransferase